MKRAVAHAVLDVVAEDPQVQHVAADVHQPAVQEHRRDERDQRELGGNQAVGEDERLPAGAERELIREHQHVQHDDADRDHRRRSGRNDVAQGNHRRQVQCSSRVAPDAGPGHTGTCTHDLPTLWNRDSRQSADLFSLRKSHRRTPDHAADRRLDLQRAEAIALAARRRRRRRAAGAARLVGSLRVVSTATSRGLVARHRGVQPLGAVSALLEDADPGARARGAGAPHRVVVRAAGRLRGVAAALGHAVAGAVAARGRRLRGGGGAHRRQLVSVRLGGHLGAGAADQPRLLHHAARQRGLRRGDVRRAAAPAAVGGRGGGRRRAWCIWRSRSGASRGCRSAWRAASAPTASSRSWRRLSAVDGAGARDGDSVAAGRGVPGPAGVARHRRVPAQGRRRPTCCWSSAGWSRSCRCCCSPRRSG